MFNWFKRNSRPTTANSSTKNYRLTESYGLFENVLDNTLKFIDAWHTLVEYAEAAEKKLVLDAEVAVLSTAEKLVLIVKDLARLSVTYAMEPVRLMIKRKEDTYA